MQQQGDYRDKVSTISEDGSRVWLYPKQPKGWYYNKRKMVSIILLTILFTVPFIQIDGHPFFLFNFLERKFILFGFVFWPQDFHLFVLAMISFMLFIVLFTVVYGRIWCGWACPQTIFMEMVFRRIEYWIEGTPSQQKKLNKAPWNAEKIRKKGLKHSIFVAISFIIANTLLAYIVGIKDLSVLIASSPFDHFGLFGAVIAFTALFYSIFSFFREQACTVVCPYGRLQGVFLDNSSIAVSYDYKRGEPRGKKDKTFGDCVDCNLCVQVCPTGIDIRNGQQLECVNCTACIDACDEVMVKIKKPKGLIRYASKLNISKGESFKFTTRMIAYSAVLSVLLIILFSMFGSRTPIETTLLRARGSLYEKIGTDTISNIYTFQIVNKQFEPVSFDLELNTPNQGTIKQIIPKKTIPKQEVVHGTLLVKIPRSELTGLKTELKLNVVSEGKIIDVIETSFLGPSK